MGKCVYISQTVNQHPDSHSIMCIILWYIFHHIIHPLLSANFNINILVQLQVFTFNTNIPCLLNNIRYGFYLAQTRPTHILKLLLSFFIITCDLCAHSFKIIGTKWNRKFYCALFTTVEWCKSTHTLIRIHYKIDLFTWMHRFANHLHTTLNTHIVAPKVMAKGKSVWGA